MTACDDRLGEGSAPHSKPVLAWCLGLVVLAVVFSVWLRWPGFTQGGFASHDVAGVLYNAMVLDGGGLPYVDTVELKAPGAFYLAWAAADGGRDIARFQVWANAWAVLALVGVAVLAWRHFGPRASAAAAWVYALHDAHLDSMDANYVTWANLPAILAASFGLWAMERDDETRAIGWGTAGLLAGFATLAKRPAGIILVVLLVWAFVPWLVGRGRRAADSGQVSTLRRPSMDAALVVVGFVVAHLPVLAHFGSRGHASDFVAGYVLNRWGADYVASGVASRGLVEQVGEGLLATTYFLAPALVLAAFSVGRGAHLEGIEARRRAALVVWAVASIAAAWVGFRFYKGYFLAAAAPLALLAAAPWGLFAAERWRGTERWASVLVGVLFAGLLVRQSVLLAAVRADRGRAHDLGGRAIAEHVLANAEADDQIWVWGWHLWDVYPLTGQMAGSRIYKSIGLLTPPNDDSWRHPASRAVFVDGPAARMLVDDLQRSRPRYIVFGSTVPWRQFTALRRFLAAEYTQDRRVRLGRVAFFRRKDDAPGPRWQSGQHPSGESVVAQGERDVGGAP